MSGGGVMAQDDDHAIIEVAKAVRKMGADWPGGLPLDYLISIMKPDGSELSMPATVAEFLKK